MPTRQEVLEGFRVLAEEILESLRVLFTMLFTMTRAMSPEENLDEAEMHPIRALVTEVKNQRQKIMELSQLITGQINIPSVTSPLNSSGAPSDVWEAIEMEAESVQGQVHQGSPGPARAAQGPGTSVPTASSPPLPSQTYGGRPPTKIAGIPIPGAPSQHQVPTPSEAAGSSHNQGGGQVALTQATLDAWGAKVVTWGRKAKGQTYVNTYETDHGYVKWILQRVGSLHEDIEDFANYCITRRRLEAVVQQQVRG